MNMKLEVVPIPVRNVDTAKDFYTRQVGFNLDHDVRPSENMRVADDATARHALVTAEGRWRTRLVGVQTRRRDPTLSAANSPGGRRHQRCSRCKARRLRFASSNPDGTCGNQEYKRASTANQDSAGR
jgi:hypothetical protein